MGKPLDEFLISLADWEHVQVLREISHVAEIIGALIFIGIWLAALVIWLGGMRDARENKRGWFWYMNPHNNYVQRFLTVWVLAALVWAIAAWPLSLTGLGLVSEEAVETFLGYDAIFSGGDL